MKISAEINVEVGKLLTQNRRIEAIQVVHNYAKCGLKEAKDYVDNFVLTERQELGRGNIDGILLELLLRGKKVEAVKMYKDASKLGLKESKNYVENLYDQSDSLTKKSESRDTDIQNIILHTNNRSSVHNPLRSFLIKLVIIIVLAFALVYFMFKM